MPTIKKESGSEKLDRSKLRRFQEVPEVPDNSVRSIVVLALLVILVAVVGAYFIKQYQSSNSNTSNNTQPTETVAPTETAKPIDKRIILKSGNLVSSNLSDVPSEDQFTDKDSDFGNKDTQGKFTLEGITGQQYTDFYKFDFQFRPETSTQEAKAPFTSVNYRATLNEVEFSFANVTKDSTEASLGEVFDISYSNVSALVKSMKSDDTLLVYKLKFVENAKYFVTTKDNTVSVFVLGKSNQPDDTSELVPDTTPTITPTVTTTSTGLRKDIESSVAGNVAGVKGHSYEDSTTKFDYMLKLSNAEVPNVTSEVKTEDGKNYIYVYIENLAFDGIAGNDQYGEIDFKAKGVRNLVSMTSDYKSGKSTYKFELASPAEYKVFLNDKDYSEKRIVIEFIH